jgi:transposase
MDQQCHYVGLDVSLETTSICVIDDAGAIIWRGKCRSDPPRLPPSCANMRQARCGLETGQLSNWLTLSLRRRGMPVICMDARHAKAALSIQINKPTRMTRSAWHRWFAPGATGRSR